MHVLRSIFHWLDINPDSYWFLVIAAGAVLALRLGRLVIQETRGTAAPGMMPGWVDALVLFLFLFAWRWPYMFVAYEYNPDESQMIAGAMTLGHDPIFWRSVDGGSSGPLNYYLLLPWRWVGAPLDYFTARVTCMGLIWGALFVSLRTLARTFGLTVAWLGVLPAAAFLATTSHPELTFLSTEHLPLLLIAVAFGLLAGRQPGDRLKLWAGCLAAGALPWTKLQSVPVSLVLLGWAWWQVLREPQVAAGLRWRRAAEVLLAAALPTLFFLGMTAVTGQLETIWRRFFLQNLLYVRTGTAPSIGETVNALWRHAGYDGSFRLFFITVVAGVLAGAAFLAWRRTRPSAFMLAATAVALVTLAAVIAPRREYLHYVLLLPVPFTLWFGAALGEGWRQLPGPRSHLILVGLGLVAGLTPLVTRSLRAGPPVYGDFSYHWRHPRSAAAAVLHALAGRDDSLAIWGWAGNLHVESGLRQATRDGNTLWSIEPNQQKDYHRAVYLADLKRSAPAVFVDAIGPGAFFYKDRGWQSHEHFAELADYIRQNYTLVTDLGDARIYARNDLSTLRQLTPARLRQLLDQGRESTKYLMVPPTPGLEKLQRRVVAHRMCAMLHPPTVLDWNLDADIRAVSIEFGFDPSEKAPARSNGAELILELVDAQSTREIYYRFLDPGRQSQDRGPQTAWLTLPPFGPGTILRLRTECGPYGDGAWDWIYLSGLKLHQQPDPDPK